MFIAVSSLIGTARVATICALLSISSIGASAVIAVNRDHDVTNDFDGGCSLREALRSANENTPYDDCTAGTDNQVDIVLINVTGPIALNAEIPIYGSVLIAGSATLPSTPVIDMGLNHRAFSFNQSDANDDDLAIANLVIRNGQAPAGENGGALLIEDAGRIEIIDVEFANNAAGSGGGVYIAATAAEELLLEDSVFVGNRANFSGGGLSVANGIASGLEILHTRFIDNREFFGDGGGGALLRFSGFEARIEDSVFIGNRGGEGGGLLVQRGSGPVHNTRVLRCAFIGNQAEDGPGGGIHMGSIGMRLNLINSTVACNQAEGRGGGVFMESADNRLAHATLVWNSSATGAGGNLAGALTTAFHLDVIGAIVAHSLSGVNCEMPGASVASHGGNIHDDGSCQFSDASDLNTDPGLSGLLLGVGGQPGFVASADSVALDVFENLGCEDTDGNALSTDQQGQPRELDGDGNGLSGCDAGAFEAPEDTDLIWADALGG